MKYFSILMLLFFLCSAVSASDNNENTSELLKNVENAYTDLDTYYDKGRIITKGVYIEFETYYKLENLFLFDWVEDDSLYGKKLYHWMCINDKGIFYSFDNGKIKTVKKQESLKSAIINSLGRSMGGLRNIPVQLLDNSGLKKLTSLRNSKIIGTDIIDGNSCIYLTAENTLFDGTNSVYHIWILEKNNMIKKIKRISANSEVVYVYDKIKVNADIPEIKTEKILSKLSDF